VSSVQGSARIRFEQGLDGGRAIAHGKDVLVVVVDVLSFSTCVSVAVDRGIDVIPVRWRDSCADELARAHDAVIAGPRGCDGVSLSPASIRRAAGIEALVLPSPNGATLCIELAAHGPVVAGCLRNASAVAAACAVHLDRSSTSAVAVVAAGERWDDDSLRPAWEDVWGAGAIIAALDHAATASPEALAAVDAYRAVVLHGLPLAALTSGIELIERHFAEDVAIAGELDASAVVPLLTDGVFAAS
jgi:2-phosphosulfolactate phosphatase